MKRDAPLNERQARVLRWVSEGCPEGVFGGHGHKVTAVALQNRGLVTVSRSAGLWRATLTAAGMRHLGQEADAGLRERLHVAERAGQGCDRSAHDAQGANVAVGVPERPAVPVTREPAVAGSAPALRHVPVPGQLRRPLPVVQALRQAAAAHKSGVDGRLDLRRGQVLPVQVSRVALPRLLRVLQAVGREAELRGAQLQVRPGTSQRGTDGRAAAVLSRGDDQVVLRVLEETDRVPHVSNQAEVARARREPWWKPPTFDYHPSGRLRLKLEAPGLKQSSFVDGVRRRLEDQLPQFFDAAEEALNRELSGRLERQRRQDEQRRQADLAEAQVHAKARHERLARIAEAQADSWRTAQNLRRYADALEVVAKDADAAAWAQWVRTYADDTDPVTQSPGFPPHREPPWIERARHLPGGYC